MVPTHYLAALAFLLSLSTVSARWCQREEETNGRKCCPFSGIKKPTCRATGTSSIADLLAILLRNQTVYFIAGRREDFFGVYACQYHYDQGSQLYIKLVTQYAYVLEIPASDYTNQTFYIIPVTGCPTIYEINAFSKGYLEGTSLLLRIIYYVCFGYKDTTYPAGCNLFAGNYIETFNDNTAYSLHVNIALFASSAISMRYAPVNPNTTKFDYKYLPEIAQKNKLNIEYARCPCTVTERGHANKSQACYDPFPQETIGRTLIKIRFNFGILKEVGGLCTLFTTIAYIFAQSKAYQLFAWSRLSFLIYPYLYVIQINALVYVSLAFPTYRQFCRACA